MLIDLSSWDAKLASGMTMDMGSSKMINAGRQYSQGVKQLNAMVMAGNQAMTQGSMQAMQIETAEDKVSVTTIDGFKVMLQYSKADKSGAVMVYLKQNQTQGAMFTLVYEGLSDEGGINAAKKFNWKEMQAAVSKLF